MAFQEFERGLLSLMQERQDLSRLVHSARAARNPDNFFAKVSDLHGLESLLATLAASLIPPPEPFDYTTIPSRRANVERATKSLVELSNFIQSLYDERQNQQFKEQSFHLIIEKWDDVVKWLIFFVVRAQTLPVIVGSKIVKICTAPFIPLAMGVDDNPYCQELLSAPQTIDFLILLICQIDDRTGVYHYIPSDGQPCRVVHTVWAIVKTLDDLGTDLFAARLTLLSKRMRAKVLTALISRPQAILQVVEREGLDLASAAFTFVNIFDMIKKLCYLTDVLFYFLRRDVFYVCSTAVSRLTDLGGRKCPDDQTFWTYIAASVLTIVEGTIFLSSPDPHSAMTRAIEGGVLGSGLQSLSVKKQTGKLSIVTNASISNSFTQDSYFIAQRLSNEFLPPLPTLNQEGSSTISVFDFTVKHQLTVDVTMSKAAYDSKVWQYINLHLEARVQHYVDDVAASAEEFRLVEGVFVFDFIQAVFVLAKVKYDPDKPDGQRYKVVNGMFRLRMDTMAIGNLIKSRAAKIVVGGGDVEGQHERAVSMIERHGSIRGVEEGPVEGQGDSGKAEPVVRGRGIQNAEEGMGEGYGEIRRVPVKRTVTPTITTATAAPSENATVATGTPPPTNAGVHVGTKTPSPAGNNVLRRRSRSNSRGRLVPKVSLKRPSTGGGSDGIKKQNTGDEDPSTTPTPSPIPIGRSPSRKYKPKASLSLQQRLVEKGLLSVSTPDLLEGEKGVSTLGASSSTVTSPVGPSRPRRQHRRMGSTPTTLSTVCYSSVSRTIFLFDTRPKDVHSQTGDLYLYNINRTAALTQAVPEAVDKRREESPSDFDNFNAALALEHCVLRCFGSTGAEPAKSCFSRHINSPTSFGAGPP
ncbi:hypothetical protein MD484_g2745, partial [Candolleomyces efflorescens]